MEHYFGSAIINVLTDFGLQQNDIARALGVNHAVVSGWKHGTRPIPARHAKSLWQYFLDACDAQLEAALAQGPEAVAQVEAAIADAMQEAAAQFLAVKYARALEVRRTLERLRPFATMDLGKLDALLMEDQVARETLKHAARDLEAAIWSCERGAPLTDERHLPSLAAIGRAVGDQAAKGDASTTPKGGKDARRRT
jgi:hypothetical protein